MYTCFLLRQLVDVTIHSIYLFGLLWKLMNTLISCLLTQVWFSLILVWLKSKHFYVFIGCTCGLYMKASGNMVFFHDLLHDVFCCHVCFCLVSWSYFVELSEIQYHCVPGCKCSCISSTFFDHHKHKLPCIKKCKCIYSVILHICMYVYMSWQHHIFFHVSYI